VTEMVEMKYGNKNLEIERDKLWSILTGCDAQNLHEVEKSRSSNKTEFQIESHRQFYKDRHLEINRIKKFLRI
jgi:hypothetical protein